jgi:hypothetical protein
MQLGYMVVYLPDIESALAFSLEQGFLCDSEQFGDLSTGSTRL